LKFRPKGENELSRLSDDDLVAYLSAARDAGQDDQVRLAIGIFVFSRIEILKARAKLKIADDQDVEEVVQDTIEGSLRAAFRGESPGELFNLMDTILKRRISDFYKQRERTPAFAGPDADGNDPLDQYADTEDAITGLLSSVVVNEQLELCSDRDRMIVERKMAGHPSLEIADEVSKSGVPGGEGMTDDNVDQIWRRFKLRVRDPLLDPGLNLNRPPDEPGPGIQA
jgi:DNA-directed RNA polymerase specialized sigma24 family protein